MYLIFVTEDINKGQQER